MNNWATGKLTFTLVSRVMAGMVLCWALEANSRVSRWGGVSGASQCKWPALLSMEFAFGARMVVLTHRVYKMAHVCRLPWSPPFLKLISSGLSLRGRGWISLALANQQLSLGGIVCRFFVGFVGFFFFLNSIWIWIFLNHWLWVWNSISNF